MTPPSDADRPGPEPERAERGRPDAAVADDDGEPTIDGAFSADGVDLTLIQWMLERTPEERLQTLQSMVDFVAVTRGGGPD
jgi:hypothetical protein